MIILILSLITLSLAQKGYIQLPHNLKLLWNFPNQNTIQFQLQIPEEITNQFGWVGLGFKDSEQGRIMTHSDIVVFYLADQLIDDQFAEKNGRPEIDVQKEGEYDLLLQFITQQSGYTIYTWSRKLDTGDTNYDKVLSKDGWYNILWAFGKLNDQGHLSKHLTPNRGSDLIQLNTIFQKSTIDTTAFLFLHN